MGTWPSVNESYCNAILDSEIQSDQSADEHVHALVSSTFRIMYWTVDQLYYDLVNNMLNLLY